MQIFEITHKTSSLAEQTYTKSAGGILIPSSSAKPASAAASARTPATTPTTAPAGSTSKLGALTKAIGAATRSAFAQDAAKYGINLEPEQNPYGDKEAKAAAAAKPVIDQQAKQQQALWSKALTSMQNEQGVQSAAQLSQASQGELFRSLNSQLHSTLLKNKLGSDYKNLPDFVSSDPDTQARAQQIVKQLSDSLASIKDLAKMKTAQDITTEWQVLSQAAYDAMALTTFRPKNYSMSSNKPPAAGSSAANPAANPVQQTQAQIMSQTGITPTQLTQMQSVFRNLPSVRTQNPQIQLVLQALGLKP